MNHGAAAFTGSVNVTATFESTGTSVAPLMGVVDWTAGAASPPAETTMSSIPTYPPSFPTGVGRDDAKVDQRLVAALARQRPALTAVTCVATPGPVVASATNPGGTPLSAGLPGRADAVLKRDSLYRVVGRAGVDIAHVVRNETRWPTPRWC